MFKIIILTDPVITFTANVNFPAPTAQEMRYERRPSSLVLEGSSVTVLPNEKREASFLFLLGEAVRPELALESRSLQTAPETIFLCFIFKVAEREIKRMPISERASPALQQEIVRKIKDSTTPTKSREIF